MLNTRKNILILTLLLALGLVMVLVMKMMVSMETGTIVVALLVPFLAYAVLSGAIEELGFGGVKAKFNQAASSTMQLAEAGSMLPRSEDFDQVGQEGQAAIEEMLNIYKFNDSRPIVLNIKLGRGDYERLPLFNFVKQLSQHRSFKLIIFVDQYDRVAASLPALSAYQLLANEVTGEKLIQYVNENCVEELWNLPRIIQKQLTLQGTNAEALRQMSAVNVDALPVVDADRYLKGVVEREDVLTSMMLALVDRQKT